MPQTILLTWRSGGNSSPLGPPEQVKSIWSWESMFQWDLQVKLLPFRRKVCLSKQFTEQGPSQQRDGTLRQMEEAEEAV